MNRIILGNSSKAFMAVFVGVAIALSADVALAAAGGAGNEFNTVWTMLEGWVKGTLGKIIALTFIIVGVVAGIAKGSIFGLVTGVGLGIALITAPAVLTTMFAATLPIEQAMTAVQHVALPDEPVMAMVMAGG